MDNQAGIIDFIHPVLNTEIRTISGHYVLSSEKRLSFNDHDVLYYIGCATVDAACCAVGGCAYALIAGYIKAWKYKKSGGGLHVSGVEHITDSKTRSEVRRLILNKEPVQQVKFEG